MYTIAKHSTKRALPKTLIPTSTAASDNNNKWDAQLKKTLILKWKLNPQTQTKKPAVGNLHIDFLLLRYLTTVNYFQTQQHEIKRRTVQRYSQNFSHHPPYLFPVVVLSRVMVIGCFDDCSSDYHQSIHKDVAKPQTIHMRLEKKKQKKNTNTNICRHK